MERLDMSMLLGEDMWYYDCLLSPKSKEQKASRMDSSSESKINKEKEEVEFVVCCIFRAMDEDGDGRVSAVEVANFVDRVGMWMPLGEVESLVKGMSASCDDSLTFHEFCQLYHQLFSYDKNGDEGNDGELREAFSVFDENGDGVISAQELGQVLCRLGFGEHGRDERRCRRMIQRADLNGDGLIDIHEFKHLLSSYK